MKRSVLFLLVAVLGALSVSAQVYLGGSLSLSSSTTKTETQETTLSSVTFAPEVGYSLTHKLDLGFSMPFSLSNNSSGNNVTKSTTQANYYAVVPYIRYSLIEFNKFNVLGKAALLAGGGTSKYGENSKMSFTNFGFSVSPILMYDLSKHFALLANLNFLSLSINYSNSKADDTDLGSTTIFNFGIDSNNVAKLGSNSGLTIGFAYKF
jgi:hypothetical protein